MAAVPSYAPMGEAALDRVLERFLAKHPGDAQEYRDYFQTKREILVRLAWAIARRVEAHWAFPADIAERSMDALIRAYQKALPEDAVQIIDWFRENDAFLTPLAKAIATDLVQSNPAPAHQVQAQTLNKRNLERIATLAAAEYILEHRQLFDTEAVNRADALLKDVADREKLLTRLWAEEKWLAERGYFQQAAAKTKELEDAKAWLPEDYGGSLPQRDLLSGSGIKPHKPAGFAQDHVKEQCSTTQPAVEVAAQTPGTNLRWSNLCEWLAARREIDNRPPSSDRHSALSAHVAALTLPVVLAGAPAELDTLARIIHERSDSVGVAIKDWIERARQEHDRKEGKLPPRREDEEPELWSPAERELANIEAILIVFGGGPKNHEERRAVRRYSGMGGLSIKKMASRLPADWLPELQGLVNEYYTPTRLTREVARVLLPMLRAMQPQDAPILALEPSAGVGRFINALSGPEYERLKWTAVEYSHVSARILQASRPDITVVHAPFEQWVAENEAEVAGKLGLVVSNPPYGRRGATVTLDPDRDYRERQAYVYFLRRAADLLRPGGLSVFLIPYGFLSGKTSAAVKLRTKVFLRHHLIAAFRLPSQLFPGANIVTDLLFFEARGGELKEILADDREIVDEGRYFGINPTHILGTVIGEQDADDPDLITKKARFGYEIAGEFTELPPFLPRPICRTCWVAPLRRTVRAKSAGPAREDLPLHLQSAVIIGERVAEYLRHYGATSESDSAKTAAALYGELRDALLAWREGRRAEGQATPWTDLKLQKATKDFPELVTFLSAFENDGELSRAFAEAPLYRPRYQGATDDIVAQAKFLYSTVRRFATKHLLSLRKDLRLSRGLADVEVAAEVLEATLFAAGWCLDRGEWLPEEVYYTGDLWPKYQRAKEESERDDAQAKIQATRLYSLINPPPLADITPEPRMPFVPADVLQRWLESFTGAEVPALDRESGLLKIAGEPYAYVEKEADARLRTALGYINHDLALFQLKYVKRYIPELEREETALEALDRVRLEYGKKAVDDFAAWLKRNKDAARSLEIAYASAFRGYILPTFEPRDLDIARWRGDFKLRPHQKVGAWRLLFHGGGLLSFDVGVGKTLTGIAVAARMRQEGRARRIMCVLPNTIMLKWEKEIRRALPDYRVLLIGVEKYIGRSGMMRTRTDTEQERALKYRQFQAGEFDIALVTYSMFGRTGMRAETLRRFVAASPPLMRELGLRTRNTMADFASEEAKRDAAAEKKKKKSKLASIGAVRRVKGVEAVENATPSELQAMRLEVAEILAKEEAAQHDELARLLDKLEDVSERNKAVFNLQVDRWIAETLEAQDEDSGPRWEDLKVDLLILDEAQNFKNLWAVQPREGGIPKFLGAIQEGSNRAWDFAMRAFEVRERNGGSGVVLLSATPAKNSPLEYFTLLGYVDTEAWTRLGITTPEIFIDRYLRLESRLLIEPDLKQKQRLVVAGFKNLNELRDVVFRYAEFRTAQEVGLKLPETDRKTIMVPMSAVQRQQFSDLATEYTETLKKAGVGDAAQKAKLKRRALGLLQRMALVSIHPELDAPPAETKKAAAEKKTEEDEAAADPLVGAALTDALALAGMTPSDAVQTTTLKKAHRVGWTWANARLARNYASPKISEAARLGAATAQCGHIYFCENVAVHYWLKQELIRLGVAAERIAVLNADTAPTPQHRQTIAEKFNGTAPILGPTGEIEVEGEAPEYDHVIANSVAYEGIDLQVRTCDVTHLDFPWEPATLQQRNGRAVRQGNMQAVIRILYLASERSTDLLRLQMIEGKLGWMKDLLASADRETNNPIADTEMSLEEMLLFVSADPEQAQKAMLELKRQQEVQSRRATRKAAWDMLRSISERAQLLKELKDAEQFAAAHAAIDEAKARLQQIPTDVWRWGYIIEHAERGVPMAFGGNLNEGDGFALWEGAHFFRPQPEPQPPLAFEVGRVSGDVVGLRWLGKAQWHGESVMDLSEVAEQPLSDTLEKTAIANDFAAIWPDDVDQQGIADEIERQLQSRQMDAGDLESLIRHSHEPWRVRVWTTWGERIVENLRNGARRDEIALPMVDEQGELVLVPAGPPMRERAYRVLPFTEPGWAEYIERAGKWSKGWTELNATADLWWGRPFPRGILSKRDDSADVEDWIEVRTAQGREKVKALWRSTHFAIHHPITADAADSEVFTLTHMPTGMRIDAFPSLAHAKVTARFLESVQIDWSESDSSNINVPAHVARTVRRIKEAETAPKLSELRADVNQ